jgi:curli biogenesis system outer membrane secretion channel CsgG
MSVRHHQASRSERWLSTGMPATSRRRSARPWKNLVRSTAAVGTLLALSACGQVTPETVLVAAQPAADPVRPLTPYSEALRCINQQIRTATGHAVTLTVGSVPDATGRITPGLRDMVTSAAAEVTAGGQRFDLTEVAVVPDLGFNYAGIRPHPGGALIGIGQIRLNNGLQLIGSLTQADRGNQSSNIAVGGSYQNNNIDAAKTDDISTLALDLRLVDITNGLSIVNTTRSMLAVQTRGSSANAAMTIGSFGLSFSYSLTRQEGAHQAVRTLIELSVAELLGQAARVPYWVCLKVDRRNPAVVERIARWFTAMTPAGREQDVRERLRSAGYQITAAPGSAADAIVAFQRANSLVPSGRADFETYAQLVMALMPSDVLANPLPKDPPPPSMTPLPTPAAALTGAAPSVPQLRHDAPVRTIGTAAEARRT